jgi:uncharacterized DUF497 family protein
MKFIWDPDKSASNKEKHGIDFDQAKEVFMDNNAIVDQAKRVENEERWLAIGKTLKLFIVAIVFTIRDTTIRIISARQARKSEIKEYIRNLFKADTDHEDNENR